MSEEIIIGTSRISERWRISLLKDARETFRELGDDPEIGDLIVFKRRGDEILIELT